MKIAFAAAAATLALAVSAPAMAQSENGKQGLYLRLDSGWSFSRDAGQDFDIDVQDSPIVGGGVGYRLNEYLRGDVTISYRGGYKAEDSQTVGGVTGSAEADISALTGMVNVYADAPKLFDFVTPYVGGGIGVSRNHVGETDVSLLGTTATVDSESKTSFAWQVGAGVGIDVAPNWTIDVGYRYIDLGEMQTGDTVTLGGTSVSGVRQKGDLTAHEIQVGLRYQF